MDSVCELELRTEHPGGLIADIHYASKGTDGTRRVTAELRLGYDITANRRAVRRIMRSLWTAGPSSPEAKRREPQTDGVRPQVISCCASSHETLPIGCG
jgi:hypothetical protein